MSSAEPPLLLGAQRPRIAHCAFRKRHEDSAATGSLVVCEPPLRHCVEYVHKARRGTTTNDDDDVVCERGTWIGVAEERKGGYYTHDAWHADTFVRAYAARAAAAASPLFLHEVILANVPCKPYFDVDVALDDGAAVAAHFDGEHFMHRLRACIREVAHQWCGGATSSGGDVLELDASNARKFSRHVIVQHAHCMSAPECRAFALHVQHRLGGAATTALDTQVYSNNHLFRLPYSAKLSSVTRTLRPVVVAAHHLDVVRRAMITAYIDADTSVLLGAPRSTAGAQIVPLRVQQAVRRSGGADFHAQYDSINVPPHVMNLAHCVPLVDGRVKAVLYNAQHNRALVKTANSTCVLKGARHTSNGNCMYAVLDVARGAYQWRCYANSCRNMQSDWYTINGDEDDEKAADEPRMGPTIARLLMGRTNSGMKRVRRTRDNDGTNVDSERI